MCVRRTDFIVNVSTACCYVAPLVDDTICLHICINLLKVIYNTLCFEPTSVIFIHFLLTCRVPVLLISILLSYLNVARYAEDICTRLVLVHIQCQVYRLILLSCHCKLQYSV